MQNITFEEIEKLEDFGDIYEVATRYDIPLDSCDTCEDFKERIILHKQKLSGHHKHLLDQQRYEKLKIENRQKRETICSIFQSVQQNLEGDFDLLTKILESRGFTEDLSRDVSDHLNSLRDGECNIVIAGQTSAGKSTLLNLLLGMDILPKHCLSCTSSICKLRYAPKFKVRITQSQEVNERELRSQEETTAYLENLIAEKEFSRRARGDTIPEVEIYLPADILKCGITLVDTPGFGEYEAMDNLVKDFVTRGHVAAFIYVIKTDSAGGVQEDRLVRFLKTFLENNKRHEGDTKKEKDQLSFNPRAALFVCNRWDQIEDTDKPEVKNCVLEKLKDVWPRLENNQVCFFSTTRAQASLDVDKEYITKELHQLLNSLNGLFVLAHQDTIRISYGWLKTVMRECTVYLKTILYQIAMAEREHEQKFDHARKQLEALQTRADDIMEELRKELEEASVSLLKKFRGVLSSESFKDRVTDWKISEILPLPSIPSEMEEYNERVDAMIVNKIFRLFDNMDECKAFVSDLRSNMLCKIKDGLRLLDDDMEEISADLNGGSFRSSRSSNRSGSSEEEETIVAELKIRRDAKCVTQRIRNYMYARNESGGLNPRAFVCRKLAPIVCKAVDVFMERRALQKHQYERRVSTGNPKHSMVVRTDKVIRVIGTDEQLLMKFVSRYTDRLVNQINSISLNIPAFIRSNETLMKEIVLCRKERRKDRNELKIVMEVLEHLKEMLRGFGYLHVKDFGSDDMIFRQDTPLGGSSTRFKVDTGYLKSSRSEVGSKRDLCQGLWGFAIKAELSVDERRVPVMARCYTNQLQNQHLFKEIAKIRCLEHPCLATFLGMTHVDNQSAFVFDGHLTTARRYLRRHTTDVRSAVSSILMGIVDGLEAIHRDELVHMELTLDTVMVTDCGEVKLCNMCLPRKCKFPSDREAVDAADFTCLSPKVLKGGLYTRDADVYSFGIIVYELLMPQKPFEEQRTWKLSRFIQNVRPALMLNFGSQHMSDNLSYLLRGCLLRGQWLQLPLIRIKEILKMLNDDSTVSGLRGLRDKIMRKTSSVTSSSHRTPMKRSTRSSSSDPVLETRTEREYFSSFLK